MTPWSDDEIEATVASYMQMLAAELGGEGYSKADHRRRLVSRLNHRSEGAVERKHQNISAVLDELGLRYVAGYKPLSHYQSDLAEAVRVYLSENPPFRLLLENASSDA